MAPRAHQSTPVPNAQLNILRKKCEKRNTMRMTKENFWGKIVRGSYNTVVFIAVGISLSASMKKIS